MIARFSVPDEDALVLGKRFTTAIGERMAVMRFWPGVKNIEFHTERGKGIMTVEASGRAISGVQRACAWIGMNRYT